MRVLFISHDASRSGAPTALLQILRSLKQYHPDIEFDLLLLAGGALVAEFEDICPVIKGYSKQNLAYRILRRLGLCYFAYPFLNKCRKGLYDCIYANTILSIEAAVLIKHKLQIPLIGHIHEPGSVLKKVGISKEHFSELDNIITVSEMSAKSIVDYYHIPRNSISVQHPFSLWIEKYLHGDAILRPIKTPEDFIIGILFSDNWKKSTETVSIVVKHFFVKYPDVKCRFNVVGPMSETSRFRLMFDLERMNLLDKVSFIGAVERPLDYIADFDVFLLLSREESFSLTAEEAALMQTPIVGYEGATGAAEWIQKGAGILVPYMDIDKLADSLFYLYSNEEALQKYGIQGRKLVVDMYEEEKSMSVVANTIKNTNNICL